MPKKLSFKDFTVVQNKPGEDELVNYKAQKRRRGAIEPAGEQTEKKGPCGNAPCTCDKDKTETVNSAAKKPQNFRDPNTGKLGVRMVPVQKDIATEDTEIDEVLNIAQRRKAAINLKKNKAKIAMGRKRAAKKIADPARLKKRAQKQARREIAKKLTKGIPKSELTPARRAEIEKRLNKMKGKIDRIAKKSLPQVRRDEIAKKRGNK